MGYEDAGRRLGPGLERNLGHELPRDLNGLHLMASNAGRKWGSAEALVFEAKYCWINILIINVCDSSVTIIKSNYSLIVPGFMFH